MIQRWKKLRTLLRHGEHSGVIQLWKLWTCLWCARCRPLGVMCSLSVFEKFYNLVLMRLFYMISPQSSQQLCGLRVALQMWEVKAGTKLFLRSQFWVLNIKPRAWTWVSSALVWLLTVFYSCLPVWSEHSLTLSTLCVRKLVALDDIWSETQYSII